MRPLAHPIEQSLDVYPVRCTLCGAQCCTFGDGEEGMQHECKRKCCVPIAQLPRVKPAVAESADVIYHQTRKRDLAANNAEGTAAMVPKAQDMQRL